MNEPTLPQLDVAKTRLANAQAEEIDLRNARSRREVMELVVVEGLLARLHSRFLMVELGGSRLARDRVAEQLSDEMQMIRDTVTLWKAQA